MADQSPHDLSGDRNGTPERPNHVSEIARLQAEILANAKILRASKFIDGHYATRLSQNEFTNVVVSELAGIIAHALVEESNLRSLVRGNAFPDRGPGYEYSVDLAFIRPSALNELSRLNQELRRASAWSPVAGQPSPTAREAPDEPKEATETWRWAFPRKGRYYAQGRYVDAEEGDVRDLPPGYGPWVTDAGVHADRIQ